MKLQDFEKKIIIIAVILLISSALFYFYGKSIKVKIENFKIETKNTNWNFPKEKINAVSKELESVDKIKNSEEVNILKESLTKDPNQDESTQNKLEEQKDEGQ